jgi:hypothetical protein
VSAIRSGFLLLFPLLAIWELLIHIESATLSRLRLGPLRGTSRVIDIPPKCLGCLVGTLKFPDSFTFKIQNLKGAKPTGSGSPVTARFLRTRPDPH